MFSQNLRNRLLPLLLTCTTFAAPLAAQQTVPQPKPIQQPTRKASDIREKSEETIDNLLSADSYKVYGEVKNVGNLVSTGSISELVDPIMRLADPPKEFKTLIKFINANAELLANSRLIFASLPARAQLPNAFVAIEMASADDAAKFEPKLNRMLPTILPTPTPSPIPEEKSTVNTNKSTPPADKPAAKEIKSKEEPATQPKEEKPAPPPFVVTRAGNLICITDRPFKFEKLHPADSKLLTEDQNFRQAHERFATEPLFVFINIALPERSYQAPSESGHEARFKPVETIEPKEPPQPEGEEATGGPDPAATPEPPPVESVANVTIDSTATLSASAPQPPPPVLQPSMVGGSLLELLVGGQPEWPDAIGLALSQESEDYVVRSVLIGPQNSKHPLLPFTRQLMVGRSFSPAAPAILPDETELLLSVSLDWTKTYQEMLVRLDESNKERAEAVQRIPAAHRGSADKSYDPFADFELKGKFKIKEELLPVLGGEIAVAGSLSALQGDLPFGLRVAGAPPSGAKETEETAARKKHDAETSPALLMSVIDREAARRMIPKIFDGLGIGMASMLGTPVKREDTEMVDFAGTFAYAFIGDFLVISTTPTVKHIIDSYLAHQTLSSNSAYHNFTRWQASGITGQLYIAPAFMESYNKAAHDPSASIPVAMREYLMRLNPTPQAISYSLAHESSGTMHELHLPKALVLATIASAASMSKEMPPEANEAVAASLLRSISSAEATYQATDGKGSYGSLDTLISAKLIQKEILVRYGYRFDVNASGDQFEATATPMEYGKTGRLSYFVDQSGVLRGADHGGGPASAADKPLQ